MGAAELRLCPLCQEQKTNKHFRSRRKGRFHKRCKPCRIETLIQLLSDGELDVQMVDETLPTQGIRTDEDSIGAPVFGQAAHADA